MGQLLDSGTTVAGLKHDMDHHFMSHWHDFNHLTILSWHNSTGAAMANAATAADINILKPVQNGPVPDCRPDDVKFNLDYRDLCTDATPEDNTILRAEYFFELPQTSVEVLNGAGNPRMLTTFHGAADLQTLSAVEFKDQILHHVPHEGPITLADAPFGVANASIDDTSAMEIIEKLYLKIALPTIENSVFRTLCPGYTNKPHAALEGLCQSVKDEEGNVTTVTVSQYFAMIQNAIRTFANMDEYPVDVCRIFIDGLHEDIKGFFVDLYPEHAAPHPLNARSQRKSMETILTKATTAETRVLSTNRLIARSTGQVFHASTYASQCEETLQQYNVPSPAGSRSPSPTKKRARQPMGKGHSCHGCGDFTHKWADCPKRHIPAIQERAKQNIEAFAKKKTGKEGRWLKKSPNLTDFSSEARNKITKQVLEAQAKNTTVSDEASSEVSSLTNPQPNSSTPGGMGRGSTRGQKNPYIFFSDVQESITTVLSSATSRPILPVPIDTNVPHVALPLGNDNDENPVCVTAA
eukprot:scaffold109224_cov64-Cyclotella_meneghiniana.AAC.1